MSYDTGAGEISSITGYSTVREILTGDGYGFDPFGMSDVGFDYGQSQFLDVKTFTQELRFTSPSTGRFRYIGGAQIFSTDRYISTGNTYDGATDSGVQPIYRVPNPQFGLVSFAPQSQISFLADSQHQFAWAFYFDTSTEITDDLELSLNARYDSDHRNNTTLTPQEFLDANPITGRAAIPATTARSAPIPGTRSSPRRSCATRSTRTSTSMRATAAASAAAASTRPASPPPPRRPASTMSATSSTPRPPPPTRSAPRPAGSTTA